MRRMIRVKEAADLLGVTPQTVRNYCHDGKIRYELSVAGQRIFDREYIQQLAQQANGLETVHDQQIFYYIRSSGGNDTSMDAQCKLLTQNFGQPDRVFKDKASGLNEKRQGLWSMITTIAEHHQNNSNVVVCVTNKDRLTRFGFSYLEFLFSTLGAKIEVLDSDETKEPLEILMQDFMSLLASFSGKFYRLRGWENRKKFLHDVETEIDRRSRE